MPHIFELVFELEQSDKAKNNANNMRAVALLRSMIKEGLTISQMTKQLNALRCNDNANINIKSELSNVL